MASTDPGHVSVLLGSGKGLRLSSTAANGSGGIDGILRTIEGTVGGLSHALGGVFAGVGGTGLAKSLTRALLGGFFHGLLVWVATGAASLVGVLGKALSTTTQPVLSGPAFRSEFDVMAVLGAGVALPLLAVGAIQAIARQEPGTLLRSVCVRMPLALLFTGVSVQLVALGLAATDQASAMVLDAAGDPTHRLLLGLVNQLTNAGGLGLAAFGAFLVVLSAAVVAFVLWLELAVRSAAIAAASLFLPLALVGLAWPATSHWARRLGETLAALVLSKLVIAAVLALAAGLLGTSSGIAGVIEAVALLAVAAFAPFALLRLVPVVEAGALAHLEGLGRRPFGTARRLGADIAAIETGGGQGLEAIGVSSVGSSSAGDASLRIVDAIGEGPFTGHRGVDAAGPSGDSRGDDNGAVSMQFGRESPSSSRASGRRGTSVFAEPTSPGFASSATGEGENSFEAAVARWATVLAQGERRHD